MGQIEGIAEINTTIKVIKQDSGNFLKINYQKVNILGFVSHSIYVTAIQFCHCIVQVPTGNT